MPIVASWRMIVTMKLTHAGAVAGFVLLAGSLAAWGQGGPGPQGPRGPQGKAGLGQPEFLQPGPRPPQPGGPGPFNDPQLAERLGISADQRIKIEALMQEHRLRRIDLNATLQKAQVTLEPLVNAEQPDEVKILAQMDRVAEAQAELQKDEMRQQLEIRRVLTLEQWRRLQQERQQAGRGPGGPGPQGPPVN